MRRALAGAAAALLALPVLAACGGDDSGDYCSDYLASQQRLSDLAQQQAEQKGGVDLLTPSLTDFERLRDESPAELRDEWDTVVFAYRDLAEAVDRSGVAPEDFTVGQAPEGVDAATRRELTRVAAKLATGRVAEAVSGLDSYAEQVCTPDEGDTGDGSGDGSGDGTGDGSGGG